MSQKRTKLKDRVLPSYTKGEEIFNMVSHIVGGGAGDSGVGTLRDLCSDLQRCMGRCRGSDLWCYHDPFVHYVQHLSWTSSEYGKKSIPGH